MVVLNEKLVFFSKQDKYKLFVKTTDRKATIDIETSQSNGGARLQTFAAEPLAIADMKTSKLCAIGEQCSDVGVSHFVAVKENERFELAAVFSQLD